MQRKRPWLYADQSVFRCAMVLHGVTGLFLFVFCGHYTTELPSVCTDVLMNCMLSQSGESYLLFSSSPSSWGRGRKVLLQQVAKGLHQGGLVLLHLLDPLLHVLQFTMTQKQEPHQITNLPEATASLLSKPRPNNKIT